MSGERMGRADPYWMQKFKRMLDALIAIKGCTGRGEKAHEHAVNAIRDVTGTEPEEE